MSGPPDISVGTPISGSGTSLTIDKPSGLVDGDVIVIAVRAQGAVPTNQELSMPSGFSRSYGPSTTTYDRAQGLFVKPIPDASAESATTYTFGNFASGRWIAVAIILSGVDLDEVILGGSQYQLTSSTTQSISSYTASDTPYRVLAMWADERTSGNSCVPTSKPSGYTDVSNFQTGGGTGTSGSRTAFYIGTITVDEGGTTSVASASLTWPGTVAATRALSTAFSGLKDETIPTGIELKDESGDPIFLSYIDETDARVAPNLVKPWIPGFDSVDDFLSKSGATMAHRGGSVVWPEMSEYAYDRSVLAGYGALEFSCGWTSDNIPFGLGTQYLDTPAGVTGNVDPQSMTWSTLVSTYFNKLLPVSTGVWQPFYKLEDFLSKFSNSYVVAVDPKYGFGDSTKIGIMLDLCDTYGGPDRILIKFDSPTSSTVLTSAAHARGYSCMNYWAGSANSSSLASQQGNWDVIGALFSDSTMMTQAASYGKPVWGAIAQTLSDYNTAMTNGSDVVMSKNPIDIPAVSWWN